MRDNYFDFYVVRVYGDRISDLKNAGIARQDITKKRDGFKTYGSGFYAKRYPKYIYEATVGYYGVADYDGDVHLAAKAADTCAAAYPGAHVEYITRD